MSGEHEPDAPERPTPSSVDDPLVVPRGEEPAAAAEPVVDDDQPSPPVEEQPSSPVLSEPQFAPPVTAAPSRHAPPSANMLPQRERRRSGFERLIVRLIATCGIVAIGVAIAAIMVSSNTQGWIVGLVVSIVTVVLAGLLWSSRML